MALNTQVSDTVANAAVDAVRVLANSGIIRIYTGTQPANANSSATGTLLATLTFSATAFAPSVAGVATANSITGANAVASGTAGYFRVLKSDTTTVLWDGSVGTSGANLNMANTTITSGGPVSIASMTFTLPEAGA